MEYATLIFALPVTIIAYLTMASFYKVLRMERAEREGQVLRRPTMAPMGGQVPERSWKQRLEQLRAFPSLRQVTQFLDRTVRPALDDVAAEFQKQGYEMERTAMPNAHGIEEPCCGSRWILSGPFTTRLLSSRRLCRCSAAE